MDPTIIKSIIEDIQHSSRKDKELYFKQKYNEFSEKYPMIFKLSCDSKIDMKNLDFMLSMLSKMNNKEMTQDDASVKVGQMLYDKYVDPVITKP